MVATDLLRASAFFYLAAEVGNYGTSTVFVMAFLIGSMTTLFDGALYSLIPSLVKRERMADANAFVAASLFYAVVARIWWHHGFGGQFRINSS